MKSLIVVFVLSCIFFSSPAYASTTRSSDGSSLALDTIILAENASCNLSMSTDKSTIKPMVIVIGDTGEVLFLMNNQILGFNTTGESMIPALNPLKLDFN